MSAARGSARVQDENGATNEHEVIENQPDCAQEVPTTASRPNDIQILDLHGQNPVISYQNQIYYCTWSDLIGTAMFFTKAEAGVEEEAVLSTSDVRLINTSRVKLIGQKAKLVGKPRRKRRRQVEEDSSEAILAEDVYDQDLSVVSGKSLGEIRTSNPKINADIKRQANFLEKLMDVKRARGESDNVRTVFSQKSGRTRIMQPREIEDEEVRRRSEFPSTANEIEELNRRVVRGDANALGRLQDIYASTEDHALTRPSQQQIPAGRATHRREHEDDVPSANIFEQRQAPDK
jgi:TFIIIC subunit triple barrel domain